MLYKKIKDICDSKGISISYLEKSCGIGNGTIRGWEKSNPRINSLKKVADRLNVPIEELIKESTNKPDKKEVE